MAVGTINAAKELGQTYTPVVLVEIVWADGTVFRAADQPLSTADGDPIQYAGVDWTGRVSNSSEVVAAQSASDQGVAMPPSATVVLADPDGAVYTTYEQGKGIKGAQMRVSFVYWNIGQADFSSDTRVLFVGICGAPQQDPGQEFVTIPAVSKLNMSNIMVPPARVQPRCINSFAQTATARQLAADDDSSPAWACGYSPDATGVNARGNLDPSTGLPYTSCLYTFSDCMARLGQPSNNLIHIDGSSRSTGNFSGIQWAPPQSSYSRGYVSGKWEEIINNSNEAKYGDLIPLVYGIQFTEPKVANVVGDGNLTKMQVILSYGEIDSVITVVCNGYVVPHANDDSLMPNSPQGGGSAKYGFWKTVNRGLRNSSPSNDALYTDSAGNLISDPYGNLAVIEVVVPIKTATANSIPSVQVLMRGRVVRAYSSPTAFTRTYSDNAFWVLEDFLVRATAWTYDDLGQAAWNTAAALADTAISYKNLYGATGTTNADGSGHKRFAAGLTLAQRQSASDVVRGLLTACRAILVPEWSTGKLEPLVKQTLADQQPAPNAGSNYNTGITSIHADGTSGTGYAAYHFDESTIARTREGKLSFAVIQATLAQAPNTVSIPYQEQDNRNAKDSLTIKDSEDISLMGQEFAGNIQVQGIISEDYGYRAANVWLAENYRGNARLDILGQPIGDTKGTVAVEFETTFRAIHLKIGDIVVVSWQRLGWVRQMFRVVKMQPQFLGGRVKLTLWWHNDLWYTDQFGQRDGKLFASNYRTPALRQPFGWLPYAAQPVTNDSMFSATDWGFSVAQQYERAGDTTALAKLVLTGNDPVTTVPAAPGPPLVALQGTTASTGGTVPGGVTLYCTVAAKDATGSTYNASAMSSQCVVAVPAGTNTNTVTVPTFGWNSRLAKGYVVYAGTDPNRMSAQATADFPLSSGLPVFPSSVTFTALNVATWGPADPVANHNVVKIKRGKHLGVFGAPITGATATTITFPVLPGFGFTTNQWAGRDVSLLAWGQVNGVPSAYPVPIANFRIASNTSSVCTLAGGTADPTAVPRGDGTFGLQAGDVLLMRILPTVGSDSTGNYIEDAQLINAFNYLDTAVAVSTTVAGSGTAIAMTTTAAHGYTTGMRVYQMNTGVAAANGGFVITVTGSATYTLNGTSGTGVSGTGGTVQHVIDGLGTTGADVGSLIGFVSGTGRGALPVTIKSHTATRWYITGAWPVTPDSTSRPVILESTWQGGPHPQGSVAGNTKSTLRAMVIDVSNYAGQTLWVAVYSVGADGQECSEHNAVVREIYLHGAQSSLGQVTVTSTPYTVAADADVITLQTGSSVVNLPDLAGVLRHPIWLINASSSAVTVNASSGNTIAGASSMTLEAGARFQIMPNA